MTRGWKRPLSLSRSTKEKHFWLTWWTYELLFSCTRRNAVPIRWVSQTLILCARTPILWLCQSTYCARLNTYSDSVSECLFFMSECLFFLSECVSVYQDAYSVCWKLILCVRMPFIWVCRNAYSVCQNPYSVCVRMPFLQVCQNAYSVSMSECLFCVSECLFCLSKCLFSVSEPTSVCQNPSSVCQNVYSETKNAYSVCRTLI